MMTEYSFYNCIRYRNAKTRQNICCNYEVVRKDANCVANAEIKCSYLALALQTQTNTIQIYMSNVSFFISIQ